MKQLITCLFVFSLSSGFTQTISTDAPSVSAGATTVGPGVFQIETRLQYTRSYSTPGFTQDFQIPSNLFRLGLGKNFELRMINGISASHIGNSTHFSLSSFELGMKAQLFNKPDKKTQVAFLVHAQVPKFDTDYYSASGILAVNHQLNDRNAIGYNAAYAYTYNGGVYENHAFNVSLIYAHSLTDKLSLFAEFYGGHGINSWFTISSTSLNFDTGFMYLLKDNIQIDYSFGAGILETMNFHALGINFMINQKKK